MMTRTATTVWLDGHLLDDEQLRLHALTHALHYGSAVFEGIRVYPTPRGPAIFRLREHVDRLVGNEQRVTGVHQPATAVAVVNQIRDVVYYRDLRVDYRVPAAEGANGQRPHRQLVTDPHRAARRT